jgi:hypothetical protein
VTMTDIPGEFRCRVRKINNGYLVLWGSAGGTEYCADEKRVEEVLLDKIRQHAKDHSWAR